MSKAEMDTLRTYLKEAGNLEFEDGKEITSEFGEIEFYRGVPAGPTVAYTPNGWEEEYSFRFAKYCSRISDAIEELGYKGELNITKTFEDGDIEQVLSFTTKGPYAIKIDDKKITIHSEEGLHLLEYLF